MNIRFDNKTVIVTGAAHGFGRAIAHTAIPNTLPKSENFITLSFVGVFVFED